VKIAISGAGIAGPTLAYWLRRSGHEPTLIERAPRFRTGGYIIDFWGLGYSIAERMGILPQVRAAGYGVKELRIVDHHGRRIAGFSSAVFARMTQGRFTSLPRGDLAAAIYHTVARDAETVFGDSISGLEQHAAGVRVSFERGAARDFNLVVGADGLHSKVRELAFGPQSRFEKPLGYYVAALEIPGYRPRDELVYVAYTQPGRQVARFSLRNDRTMFLFVFAAERMPGSSSCAANGPHREPAPDVLGREPCDVNERTQVLRRVFADAGWECPQILRALDAVDEIYFDPVNQIRMDVWSKGRVVLIGDAAFCVSLLAGEGTGLAMTAAYVLAAELNRAGADYRAAFARYEGRLRPFIEGKQKSARNFARYFAPNSRLQLWIRNQATKLLRVPFLANRLVGPSVRDDFDLPDYEMQGPRCGPFYG
jgi:2-polyprenyl-6-methoxyphenol hydroxylase-like FAD-dependent oxidoreductase